MALNKEVFKTRALTAFVFVLIMLGGLFINFYSFAALFIIILIGCLYEFRKIIKIIKPLNYIYYTPLVIPYIIIPIIMMLVLGRKYNEAELSIQNYNPLLPCAIIFSIWINDTMAYLVGSFIGKNPLSKISPKKTWEGTIGGAILCVLVITGISAILLTTGRLQQSYLLHFSVISLICAVFGTLGDLLESKIKRLAGLKDSGHFMPGHGGFLDRFDSLLVATPFVWLYVQLFMS